MSKTKIRKPTSSSQSLIGRVQSGLPGRKRKAKPAGVQRVTDALGTVASKAPTSTPAAKAGMVGMAAGGVGFAAAVARWRSAKQDEVPAAVQTIPSTPPVEVLEAPSPATDDAGPTTTV